MNLVKYQKAVAFLESLLNLPITDYNQKIGDRSLYLARLGWFLNILNNPQNNFKFIHITGTAGKGSTVHYLHEILLAAGKKVGSYYSPHPTTDIERIRVNALYIDPDELTFLTEQLKPALTKAATESPFGIPSYFETFLALAFLYFKKQKCEYVILEAGLGGTHDATNIIKNPLLCAITNINYDHQEVLGKTLTKIATDKAGIIKKGCIFFTNEQRKPLLKIFTEKCKKLQVPMILVKAEKPNQALAKAMAEKLNINPKYIIKGLTKNRFSCRFEIIQENPKIIIDGSHNPIKLNFLANRIKTLKGKKIIIFGLAADKNLIDSLKKIVPLADVFLITRFLMTHRKSTNLKTIKKEILKIKPKLKNQIFIDPNEALTYALKIATPADNIIITGSFFLAGHLRKHWISEEKILTKRQSF